MTTFTYNNATYTANDTFSTCFMTVGDTKTRIKKAEFQAAQAEYELEQAMKNPTPDTPEQDAPAETPKAKTHPTADAFLAKMPTGYIFRTNAKGHILISKAEGDKTAYARIRPLKDGAWVFPGKELKATRTDWEYHKGWANEYALKAADWDEIKNIVFPEPEEA
jgi:hypothetical protein